MLYASSISKFVPLLLLCLPAVAMADVVTGLPQGYVDEVPFGEAAFGTTYRTPNGVPYSRDLGLNAGATRHAAGWKPGDLPIYVETGRDAHGSYVFLSTLLADPDGRPACWTELVVAERGAALRARLGREVDHWATGCAAVRTIGVDVVLTRWAAVSLDMGQALARLARVERTRYLATSAEQGARMFGLPSFLPQQVKQLVLDALADQCGLPHDHLRKQGDVVTFRLLVTGEHENDADGRVNLCILRQVGSFPSFRQEEATSERAGRPS